MHARRCDVVIIGSGPTGIGAALRLLELGRRDFVIIDRSKSAGGLAGSAVDDAGFTWDFGGHVQFSHYAKFDEYMDLAFPPEQWLWHERESWIWLKNRFIPYPFQNNLHRLAPEDRWRAVEGLIAASAKKRGFPSNFREWIHTTFGVGIAELFMEPYNAKVWAHPLEQLDYGWVGERVSTPSLEEAMRSICLERDQVSWGPNHRFRYPLRGGTGAIWQSLATRIPAENLMLGTAIESIDRRTHSVRLANGETVRYGKLINTASLKWLSAATGNAALAAETAGLKSSTVHVVGVGLEGSPPPHLHNVCWMYFPGLDTPFYRVTVFSRYSPHNVPRPGETWSLMTEVAESRHRRVDVSTIVDSVVYGMVAAGLIPESNSILSRWHKALTPGYPTPSLGREAILARVLPELEAHSIYSRGRFGAWKYEVSNQDHSFMQGVEVVDRIAFQRHEPTLNSPSLVNSRYNPFPYAEWAAA